MTAKKLFVSLLILVIALTGCSSVPGNDDSSSTGNVLRAWFDAPLPGTMFWPPNPCMIVAHGSSPNGIAVFELTINGTATSVPSPDTETSLVTLTLDCALTEPGRYLLQLRAQDNSGVWSGYAETSLIIAGQEGTGQIGGVVIADMNGNGVQEANEVGLEGADVVLKGCEPTANQTTKFDGTFQFSQVPAGSCTLEVFKGGWGFSGSNPNLGYPIPVASDPNLPTNLGILMAPMADAIPPEPTFTPVVGPADELAITEVSTWVVYVGASSCGPMETVITAHATASKGITAVILFYRFGSGDFQSISMNPIGNDLYRGTLSMASIFGSSIPFDQAIPEYQVIVQQSDGDTSLRTPVLADIEARACGSVDDSGSTDACSAYTEQRTCVAKGCNWWEIPGTPSTFVCKSKP